MRMRPVYAVAALLASAACSSPDDASGDFHLELVQAPTTVTPGSVVPQSVLVRVVNGDGTSISGVPVTWSIQSGGGTLTPSADTSGVDGLATAQWTPGLATGSQAIGASIYDQPALTIAVNAAAFRADKIGTSYRAGCGILAGAAWCWDFGSATTATVSRVMSQVHARDIAMGSTFVCVLDESGAVLCHRWFLNQNLDEVVGVSGLPALSAISGGNTSFCGISQVDRTPWCWRAGTWVGTQVSSTLQLTELSVGSSEACGLTAEGIAWCWGEVPAPLPGGHEFRQLSVGLFKSCGIVAPAQLYCWDGTHPEPAYFGISASQVAVGYSAGIVNAPLGATEFFSWSIEPPQYNLGSTFPLPVVQLSSQDDMPCVIAFDAAVYCLGVNDNIEQVYKSTWEAIPAQP